MTPQEIKIMVGHNKLREAATALKEAGKSVESEFASINEIESIRGRAEEQKRLFTTEEANTIWELSDEVSWSLIQKCNEL